MRAPIWTFPIRDTLKFALPPKPEPPFENHCLQILGLQGRRTYTPPPWKPTFFLFLGSAASMDYGIDPSFRMVCTLFPCFPKEMSTQSIIGRVHCTMEVIPALPWKAKSPSVSTPIKQSRKQGDARGASEVRRGTSSISVISGSFDRRREEGCHGGGVHSCFLGLELAELPPLRSWPLGSPCYLLSLARKQADRPSGLELWS